MCIRDRSKQSSATRSSRAVRPEPPGPVRRTERPRASSRTRRSRSSWRSRRESAGCAGPGGTGGRAARSVSVRSAEVRLRGRSGRSSGGQGSISLPSTGLTVSRKPPETSRAVRAGPGVPWPKSELRDSRGGRRPGAWPCSSGPGVIGSMGSNPPKASCALDYRPLPACCTPRCRFWSGPARGLRGCGRPNPKPLHSIYDRAGCRAVRDITVR